MSSKRQLVKVIKILSRRFSKFSNKYLTAINKPINWLLRTLFITRRRRESANAGFVLPTVVMVALVVVLLTTAILFRSFERSQNASNVRVNQAVLNAATPAINRAKAKIEQLFDPSSGLPRSTPSDETLYTAFTKNAEKYTFGDEESLQVKYDINGDKKISTTGDLEVQEAVTTAWRFPVDTDNNGKYDSYTLYSVFFRSPSRGKDGKFDRSRNPLDARTPPMDDGNLGGICAAAKGTSASLVGESGWYKSGATIKKSFFVYSTTVPITTAPTDATKFEQYKGNKGFSALEYQQDQERIPIINNAVVYEDDLEITPGSGLNLNGSIFTNSNLLTAKTSSNIRFYQVSSPKSCFYQAQNSKITVGGNVGNGRISGEGEGNSVRVDLFKPGAEGDNKNNIIDGSNKSANNTAGQIAYNTKAYAERINLLVETQSKQTSINDPKEVQDNVDARIKENAGLDAAEVRRQELEAYFKKRTRRVPFAEVKLSEPAPTTVTLGGSGDKLRPPDEWINPTDKNTGLTLYPEKLPATEPNKLKETNKEEEKFVGDRIYAGNNLPALWYDSTKDDFFGKKTPQDVDPKTEWNDWKPNDKYKYRTRFTNVQDLISLSGTTDRDGYFEIKAAEKPKNVLDNVGGMRVVTGAGIYVDGDTSELANASYRWDENLGLGKFRTSLNPRPTLDTNFVDPNSADPNKIKFNDLKFNDKGTPKNPIVVYPDSMPMAGGTGQSADKGDLQMRASAVYFYTDNSGNDNSGKDQVPIACVSSYYDPTNAVTAQNQSSLLVQAKNPDADPATILGKSNNGVVYDAPYTSDSARLSAIGTYSKQLRQQARLVFPDGRLVNEPLRNALTQFDTDPSKRSMADNSAIDTAVCSIIILGGATPSGSPLVPHRAIYETAFLDARQIKSIEQKPSVFDLTTQDYTRSIEQRQPLEVRVTVLDLDKLRTKAIGSDGKKNTTESKQEYLLPNSGIIYATRDDALRDLSDLPSNNTDKRKLISPTDYKLDPTRRPNGIMLVKGDNLVRESQYRDVEKGLILATNVPAYIKGDFNLHSKDGVKTNPVEEFTDQLRDKNTGVITWAKFYNRGTSFDDNFACRKDDPRLPNGKCAMGDSWRPATVLADAVTILSDNFRFGFRDEGDYDLRNNQGDLASDAYKTQGFFDNNFLASSSWFNNTGYPKDGSYINNFVTPIQRRVKFNEYLMEICPKVPVSSCTASDWSVDGAGKKATDEVGQDYKIATHKAGTTVDLADSSLRRYARRVAFARKPDGSLVLDEKGHPIPLGVDSSPKIEAFPNYKATIKVNGTDKSYPGSATLPRIRPDTDPPALWYRTTGSLPADGKPPTDTNYGYKHPLFYQTKDGNQLTGTDPNEQPLLVPVLQIHIPAGKVGIDPSDDRSDLPPTTDRGIATDKNWLQIANATTSNLVIAAGDTPGRPTESNGGLENFVRYLENWKDSSNISGSLIQYKRSIYATAPWQAVQLDTTNKPQSTSIFGNDYPQYYRINSTPISNVNTSINVDDNNNGMSPFYKAPSRQWGFDVALLSQLPDLFAQQFTIPPTTKPNEFFREVSRDDSWVQTLLCAKNQKDGKNAVPDSERPKDFCKKNTDFN